jgi:HNH endonuclease
VGRLRLLTHYPDSSRSQSQAASLVPPSCHVTRYPSSAFLLGPEILMLAMLCPYCGEREIDSDDHIFPQCLGGKRIVSSCVQCNSRFGHEFEGAVARDLAPFIILLRLKGVRSKVPVVWRHALQIEGVDFDLDSDLKAWPSVPTVKRDSNGKVISVTAPSEEVAKRQAARLERKSAKKARIIQTPLAPRQFNSGSFELTIGTELRRLAMKMSFATATVQGFSNLLDAEARAFLVSGAGRAVRIDYLNRDELAALRPPLSHFVFVKGNSKTGRWLRNCSILWNRPALCDLERTRLLRS